MAPAKRNSSAFKTGSLVASILEGSWRSSPPSVDETSIEALDLTVTALLKSGAAGLAWWRLRNSAVSTTASAKECRRAYVFQTLEAERLGSSLAKAFHLFRSAGIEPILVKGWAIARRYPELGLRPLGDFDLIVEPSKFLSARDLLRSADGRSLSVDLHNGFEGLDQTTFEELHSRSKTVSLDDANIRALADEDHLRVICVHLLRHGAFRPLWLCDVAVAVENTGPGFDWDLCLSKSRRQSDWVACTVALARDLLGADLGDAISGVKRKRLPVWLVNNILEKWSMPLASQYGTNKHRAPIRTYLRQPAGVLRDLRNRWPDPIAATISVNGPLNEWPRLPFQVANGVVRTARFLKSL